MSSVAIPQRRRPSWTRGDRLAKARREAGVSVAQMAVELGVIPRTINNYERDRGRLPRSVLLAYSVRCDVDRDWLEHGTEIAPGNDPEQVSSRKTCIGDGLAPVIYLQRDRAASVIADHGKAA